MSIQGLFPLGLTCLISLQSKGLSGVLSSTTIRRHQLFVPCLLYDPALTNLQDRWENHRLGYADLRRHSDVSAFQTLSRFAVVFCQEAAVF